MRKRVVVLTFRALAFHRSILHIVYGAVFYLCCVVFCEEALDRVVLLCAVMRCVLCCAVPCRAMLCCAVPCYAVPCLVPCYAVLCRAVPC